MMIAVMRLAAALVSGFLLVVAATGPAPAQSARAEIEAASAALQRAFNAREASAVAQLFTEDAAMLPPGSGRIDGREEIGRYWRDLMDAGVSNLALEASEITDSGDFAYEVGTFRATAPGARGLTTEVSGSYLAIWTKGADGAWRLHRDIWTIGRLR